MKGVKKMMISERLKSIFQEDRKNAQSLEQRHQLVLKQLQELFAYAESLEQELQIYKDDYEAHMQRERETQK